MQERLAMGRRRAWHCRWLHARVFEDAGRWRRASAPWAAHRSWRTRAQVDVGLGGVQVAEKSAAGDKDVGDVK
jgi:hypothetical protein